MTEILVDVDLGHPPERVWRALTDRRTLSEWFMRTDLEPREGSRFQLIPEGLLGLTDPLDGELVEVAAPRRLAMLWRGEQMHARVVWELEPTLDGCRLRMRHTGFLGVKGSLRRRELADTYTHMLRDRLPAALHELAAGRGVLVPAAAALPPRPPSAPTPLSLPDEPSYDDRRPRRPGLLARLARIPHRRRGQLLAVAGAVILAVITAAVISSLGVRPFTPPLGAPDDLPYDIPAGAGPGIPEPTPAGQPPGGGPQQPGGGPNSGGLPGPPTQPPPVGGAPVPPGGPGGGPGGGYAPNPPPGQPAPPPPPPAPPGAAGTPAIRASYTTTKTVPPGYRGQVTVENKGTGAGGWSVTVTVQSGARVDGVKGASFAVNGDTVTFTPEQPDDRIASGGSVVFRFQVKFRGASRPVACKINGQECAGL